jgi:N-acetylglutamate synthase-like GNAT family acetyltransferase/thioredoxin reductase
MSLNSAIALRPAGREDQAAIEALLDAHGLPLAGALDHLSSFVVALSGAEVIGCAGLELHGQAALLRSVAVAPGLQKQGIGRRLVDHVLEQARRQQVQAVYLLTTTARDYFLRQGFALAERADAPQALGRSAEFQGACPASADLMVRTLSEPQAIGIDALPVAVLGAGPVGLAAAARLIERGLPFFILEAGDRVGATLLDYGHVRLFSPWQYNVDHAMARLLSATGWTAPDAAALPLAGEIVAQVLQPFAELPQVAGVLHLRTRVVSISREGFDKVKSAGRERAPFVIRAERDGQVQQLRAKAVIDATGTWNTPNPVGASGLPAIGERAAADRIFYGIPDVLGAQRGRYAGRKTLVVGAGHSAANTLLALAELARHEPQTRLAWSVRSPVLTRVFGGGDADALPARGALGSSLRQLRDDGGLEFSAGLRITEIRDEGGQLFVAGVDAEGRPTQLSGIDQIVCATGQRPDLSLTSELRVRLDPWLESNEALGPLIDPNLHSCGTVRPHGHRELAHPEPDLYTVGVKSYGRAPTFLMATGFEQVRSVVAAIAGDIEAADRVELDLPETGVCSVGGSATEGIGDGACCGTSAAPASGVTAPAAAKAAGCGTSSCASPVVATVQAATPSAPATAPAAAAAPASSCCGGPATADASACCALDEQKKAEGAAGCGCGDAPTAVVPAAAAAPAAKASSCCA